MRPWWVIAVLGLGVLAFWSCGDKRLEQHFKEIVEAESGYFRGSSLGDPLDEVLEREDGKALVFQDSAFAKFHFHYSDTEYYEVSYRFFEGKLDEIHVQVFLGSEDEGALVTGLFTDWYAQRLGTAARESRGTLYFENQEVRVEVFDESPLYEAGVVRLTISYPQGSSAPLVM